MKLSKYPKLSKSFKSVYKQYLKKGADPVFGLALVDDFLKEYPFYPEALVFKAKMLIVLSRNREAMQYLKAAQMIDEWKVTYAFDQAEILTQWDRRDEAIDCLWNAIESLLREAMVGTDNYLLSVDCGSGERKKAELLLKQYMINLISGNKSPKNMNAIKKILIESKKK